MVNMKGKQNNTAVFIVTVHFVTTAEPVYIKTAS